MKTAQIIISCEHAVNTVPEDYQSLFLNQESILDTHYAYDQGASDIARHMSKVLECPIAEGTVSRLLIDCNRSLSHLHCFSAFTKPLPSEEKRRLIDQFYAPYRQAIETLVAHYIQQHIPVIHLSIHSFTPIFNNIERTTDIGLLYDPSRIGEKNLACRWRSEIAKEGGVYRTRMNYPYLGKSDGFVSALRKQYTEQEYLGVEVECNQNLSGPLPIRQKLSAVLTASFNRLFAI